MKKTITLLFISFFAVNAYAQDISDHAIGLRLGDGDGYGAEISYQRALGDINRLEIDLGIESGDNFNGFKATGIYQWVWNIDGGFNWYAGAGAGLGNSNLDDDFDGRDRFEDDSEFFLLAAGQIGIEYNFNIPLQLSLDFRPELYFGDFRDGIDTDIALSVRYRF